MNPKTQQALSEFLCSFEEVFHSDWSYTEFVLREEPTSHITGTFLEPGCCDNDEYNNWQNRGKLLEAYRELLKSLKADASVKFTFDEPLKWPASPGDGGDCRQSHQG